MKTMKHWSTTLVPQAAQFDYWRDVICNAFVPLRTERLHSTKVREHFRCGLNALQIGDLYIGSVFGSGQKVFRDSKEISNGNLPFYFLNIQTKGIAIVSQNGNTVSMPPSTFSLVDATRPFNMELSEDFEQISVKIPKARLDSLLPPCVDVLAKRVDSRSGVGMTVQKAFQDVAYNASSKDSISNRFAIDHALILAAYSLSRLQTSDTTPMDKYAAVRARTMDYIQLNLDDPELSPQSIAHALKLSSRYIQFAFAAEKTTLMHWILEQRLMRCKADLKKRGYGVQPFISQIAFKHGFNDLSHFNRSFKARFGVTPSHYRDN
jgi:AraC family transcriptional regulator, positive regulator of tynA and feaB